MPTLHFHIWAILSILMTIGSWVYWFFARERVRRRRLDMTPQAREQAKLALYVSLAINFASIGVTTFLLLQP